MNVTLRQLRAFLAVARTGSFTLAAESLFLSQSALSGLVKELEQSLGVRLVDRSTRRVRLTGVGESVVPIVEKTLHDLDGALGHIADLQALKTGTVRVAASQLMASALFPELIAAYRAQHPRIAVRLVDCAVESVMARVFSGEVDFGIGPEREPNSDITSTPLFAAPFVVVVPPGHALARQRQVRWSDLYAYPLIVLQGAFVDRLALDLRAAGADARLEPAHQVAFMSTALAMVNAGLGIAPCIPYAGSLVRLYGLEMRPLVRPEIRRGFDILRRKGDSLSPAAKSFLDFVTPRIRAMPFLR